MSFLHSLLYPAIRVSDRKLEKSLLNKTILISGASFGIGRFNTEEEIGYTIRKVINTVNRTRQMAV